MNLTVLSLINKYMIINNRKYRQINMIKDIIRLIAALALGIVMLYIIAMCLMVVGIVLGGVSPDDTSMLSELTRSTLAVIIR